MADLISQLSDRLGDEKLEEKSDWLQTCRSMKEKYPVVVPEYAEKKSPINPYTFLEALFKRLSENEVIVCSNGSACVCTFQAADIRPVQRLYTNSGCASMGYGLPAAIGASIGSKGRHVTCVEGDGSIQMNLQELQTVAYHQLNMAVVIINNSGYHSIRQTQAGFFGMPLHGGNNESGLGFAPFEKLAPAFWLPYYRTDSVDTAQEILDKAYTHTGPVLIEVFVDVEQPFSPKLASRRLEDGSMYSPPLDDMAPFLDREEHESMMLRLRGC